MGIEDTMGSRASHPIRSQGPKNIKDMTPNFFGGQQVDPYYQPKTEAETMAIRDKGGIAKTANNMGSLGVQFREDEEATRQAGGVTETQKRYNTLTTIRTEDRRKRWTDAARASQKFGESYKQAKKSAGGKGLDPKKNRGLGDLSNKTYAGPGRTGLGGLTAPGGASFGLFK